MNQTERAAADDIVASVDTGARKPRGNVGRLLAGTAIAWSLFQLWISSPLPFMVANVIPVLNSSETRSIHLAFSVFLAFMAFPALKRSPRDRVPLLDWTFAVAGSFSAAYLFLFYESLSDRPGAPIEADLWIAGIGLVTLLEATRRALGPPLTVVAAVFLAYVFFGDSSIFPDALRWKGASFAKAMSHQWLSTEGVFGVALGVSTSFVFLFVLFGALLERAGAGGYFIRVAFSLLGHLRGGPAKAAVVSSGMTGLISGSSIANVVTTGTFTIPLMKRVGFPPEKAGAVEVASSTNGQLTPPIMGAAAFLMIEYVGVSYIEVIKHAFLPALISYIALVYIVHLEAMKADMKGLPRRRPSNLVRSLITFLSVAIGVAVLGVAVFYGLGWIKTLTGAASPYAASALLVAAYVFLVRYAAKFPEPEDPFGNLTELPDPGPTVKSGLHYVLPVVVLVWCLGVEKFSPGLSAFWATVFLVFIVVTQRPLLAFFRDDDAGRAWRAGWGDLVASLETGARNMIGIGVATATAGVVVGTVSLTGVQWVLADFVEYISGGSLILVLLFTAVICLILGMGLPTTANYIVVASMMVPVIQTLAPQSGLVIPLIAMHMFVFYFGILADDTPPVGLAAYAASAISAGDPIKTGLQGFAYDIRTAILPFMFVFNTDLLLVDIGWGQAVFVFAVSTLAMLTFAAATQGHFLTRNRIWETAVLLLVTFTLFRPGFWLDLADPPFAEGDPVRVVEIAGKAAPGANIRLRVGGETVDGKTVSTTAVLPLGEAGGGAERLARAGLEVRVEDGKALIENVEAGSPAEEARLDFDWEISSVQMPKERIAKEAFMVPALLALAGVWWLQRRRRGT